MSTFSTPRMSLTLNWLQTGQTDTGVGGWEGVGRLRGGEGMGARAWDESVLALSGARSSADSPQLSSRASPDALPRRCQNEPRKEEKNKVDASEVCAGAFGCLIRRCHRRRGCFLRCYAGGLVSFQTVGDLDFTLGGRNTVWPPISQPLSPP